MGTTKRWRSLRIFPTDSGLASNVIFPHAAADPNKRGALSQLLARDRTCSTHWIACLKRGAVAGHVYGALYQPFNVEPGHLRLPL